jgi:hypothetical protein
VVGALRETDTRLLARRRVNVAGTISY